MPEIFNILDRNSANIVLFHAMVDAGGDDILEKFKITSEGGKSQAEVTVFVNGVEVPFTAILVEAMARLMKNYDKHVKEKAKELLSSNRLYDLHQAIENADWEISNILDELKIERN